MLNIHSDLLQIKELNINLSFEKNLILKLSFFEMKNTEKGIIASTTVFGDA